MQSGPKFQICVPVLLLPIDKNLKPRGNIDECGDVDNMRMNLVVWSTTRR